MEQFLLTAKYLFTNFEAYLAFGVSFFRKRAGLQSLEAWVEHSEPRLQHWQLPLATRDRLFAWAIEALSFGAKNPDELITKRGFQVLWRFQPDLAANVYLMLHLRRCSPGLPLGRLACRLAVPPIDVVKNLKSFLRLAPKWLWRSLYQPVDDTTKRLLTYAGLGNSSGRMLLRAVSTACAGAKRAVSIQ